MVEETSIEDDEMIIMSDVAVQDGGAASFLGSYAKIRGYIFYLNGQRATRSTRSKSLHARRASSMAIPRRRWPLYMLDAAHLCWTQTTACATLRSSRYLSNSHRTTTAGKAWPDG